MQGRLPPEQGALLLRALERAEEELRAEEDGSAEPSSSEVDTSATTAASAEATTTATTTAASAEATSGDQRRADSLARVAESALAASEPEQRRSDRFSVVVHVDAEVLSSPESDGRCHLEDGPALAPDTARRLACDGSTYESTHGPLGEVAVGRSTRVISTALRRALTIRDGTRCIFPGCTCKGRDAHHEKHWANGAATVLDNLCSLCRAHHVLVEVGKATSTNFSRARQRPACVPAGSRDGWPAVGWNLASQPPFTLRMGHQ